MTATDNRTHDSDKGSYAEGGYTLLDLLIAMCFVGPGSGAIGFSKAGHCGVKGVLLALLIGLLLGLVMAYLAYKGTNSLAGILPEKGIWWLTVPVLLAYLCWFGIASWAGSLAEQPFFPKQSAYLKHCRTIHTCDTPQATHDLENPR